MQYVIVKSSKTRGILNRHRWKIHTLKPVAYCYKSGEIQIFFHVTENVTLTKLKEDVKTEMNGS